jgi:hypothetical protein
MPLIQPPQLASSVTSRHPTETVEKIVIGYVLGGHDINARFFKDAPDGVRCPKCKFWLDRSYRPSRISVHPSQKYGFGHTDDLQPLYSRALLDLLRRESTSEFRAYLVCERPEYYHVSPSEVVSFDPERRRTVFGSPCAVCGHPTHVTGATPAYLKCSSLPEWGFFRTDLEFADGCRSALVILGASLKESIERHRFRGVFFDDAYGMA